MNFVDRALAALHEDRSGYPTWPWPSVQKALGSMVPGTLIVTGAMQGNGKTELAISILLYLIRHEVPCLVFSLEVPDYKYCQWLAASFVGIPRYTITDGLTRNESSDMYNALHSIDKCRASGVLDIDGAYSLSPEVICERIERSTARVVIIDHLQHLDYDPARPLRQAVAKAVVDIKAAAMKSGATVILLSQLSRRPGDHLQRWRIPSTSELAESGSIERVADVVLLLHRTFRKDHDVAAVKAYQETRGDTAAFEEPHTIGVHVAKHREGRPTGFSIGLKIRDSQITETESGQEGPEK